MQLPKNLSRIHARDSTYCWLALHVDGPGVKTLWDLPTKQTFTGKLQFRFLQQPDPDTGKLLAIDKSIGNDTSAKGEPAFTSFSRVPHIGVFDYMPYEGRLIYEEHFARIAREEPPLGPLRIFPPTFKEKLGTFVEIWSPELALQRERWALLCTRLNERLPKYLSRFEKDRAQSSVEWPVTRRFDRVERAFRKGKGADEVFVKGFILGFSPHPDKAVVKSKKRDEVVKDWIEPSVYIPWRGPEKSAEVEEVQPSVSLPWTEPEPDLGRLDPSVYAPWTEPGMSVGPKIELQSNENGAKGDMAKGGWEERDMKLEFKEPPADDEFSWNPSVYDPPPKKRVKPKIVLNFKESDVEEEDIELDFKEPLADDELPSKPREYDPKLMGPAKPKIELELTFKKSDVKEGDMAKDGWEEGDMELDFVEPPDDEELPSK